LREAGVADLADRLEDNDGGLDLEKEVERLMDVIFW
jgi:hypothetical protein